MSDEPDFLEAIRELVISVSKDNEMKDIRKARLAIALELIRKGEHPRDAVIKAKTLTVVLFAAASD